MKYKSIYRLLFLPLLLLINVSTYALEGNSQIQPKIIGGTPAPTNTYPWMTALVGESQDSLFQFCGGSLIDESWVITAAHCVEDITNPSILKVFIGGTNVGNLTFADVITVSGIFIHPEYIIGDVDNDIALLKLSQPSSQETLPLVDTTLESTINDGDLLKVMGWGNTLLGNDISYPDELMEVDVPLRNREQCAINYGSVNLGPNLSLDITENMICAGGIVEQTDSCQGDSGGPLVYADPNDSNKFKLLGLVSWGLECADINYPGVYTRVSRYSDFIYQTLDTQISSGGGGGGGSLPLWFAFFPLMLLIGRLTASNKAQ